MMIASTDYRLLLLLLLSVVVSVSGECADNDEDSCGRCMLTSSNKCDLMTKTCEGMEDHCDGMVSCKLVNGICVEKNNPCATATSCDQCEWNSALSICTEVVVLGNHGGSHTPTPPPSPPPSSPDRMAVTFYSGRRVVVLWDEFDVTTNSVYALCIFLSFILACSAQVSMHYIEQCKLNLYLKMAVKLLNLIISNFVMLIIMISNLGLFIAVTVGSTVGFGVSAYFFPHKKPATNFNTRVRNDIQDFTCIDDTQNVQTSNSNNYYELMQPDSRYATSVGRI
eukprot:TRINITY_DN5110_c1_g1_i1.p1 TRINITY_DN5110_c1_g1~~TRINITY_DN5110_c1_g1_i1.p1  ORF type:complete len:281 (+),score=44.16 TRINITY_DN5110_c1_g1_i1:40-882(+)